MHIMCHNKDINMKSLLNCPFNLVLMKILISIFFTKSHVISFNMAFKRQDLPNDKKSRYNNFQEANYKLASTDVPWQSSYRAKFTVYWKALSFSRHFLNHNRVCVMNISNFNYYLHYTSAESASESRE